MLNPVFLNSVLSKALQYSSACAKDPDSPSNLSFALKHMPAVLHPNGRKFTSCQCFSSQVCKQTNLHIAIWKNSGRETLREEQKKTASGFVVASSANEV